MAAIGNGKIHPQTREVHFLTPNREKTARPPYRFMIVWLLVAVFLFCYHPLQYSINNFPKLFHFST